MSDDHDDHGTEVPDEPPAFEEPNDAIYSRTTAPQSPYTGQQVGIGLAIAVVGLLVTFGVPFALA